jgi:hypothetical protein
MSPDVLGNLVATLVGAACAVVWVLLFISGKRHSARYFGLSAYIFLFPIKLWFWQFELTGRGLPHWYVYCAIFQIVGGMGYVIWFCFGRFRPVMATVALALVFSLVLQLFSYMYWAYGTAINFSVSLTHLDSFYFAIGTFTTAGTGNISPISETARGLHALQMGLDFLLIGFIVVLVTTGTPTCSTKRRSNRPRSYHRSCRPRTGPMQHDLRTYVSKPEERVPI